MDDVKVEATDAAVVMRTAADIMETRGWCEGERLNYEGRVCVLGAIEFAIGMRDPKTGIMFNTQDSYWGVSDNNPPKLLADIVKRLGLPSISNYNATTLACWSNEADEEFVVNALRKGAEKPDA